MLSGTEVELASEDVVEIQRTTAHRRWEYGLSVIVWRLNGRRVPAKRSRRYVVERVRAS